MVSLMRIGRHVGQIKYVDLRNVTLTEGERVMTKKTVHIYQYLIIVCLVSLLMFAVTAVSAHAEEPPYFALTWGGSGSGDGQFEGARRLVTDQAGNVLVADYTNNYIQKFSPMGELLLAFAPG